MRYLDSGINIVFASLGEAIQNDASLGFRTRLLHIVRNDDIFKSQYKKMDATI